MMQMMKNDIHRASTGSMSAQDLLRRIAYHDGNVKGKEVLCVSSALPCTGVVVARKVLVRSMPQLLCPGVGRILPPGIHPVFSSCRHLRRDGGMQVRASA